MSRVDSPRGAPRGGEVEGLGGVEELDGGTDLQREDEVGLGQSQTRQPYVQDLYTRLRSVHSSFPAHQEVPRE